MRPVMCFGQAMTTERARRALNRKVSGSTYFDRLNTDRLTRYHTKRLAALGYTVTLAKHAA